MKMKKIILLLSIIHILSSCTSVPPGHKAVEVSWGGKTNMEKIYSEGIHYGFHWIFDETEDYDVREKTIVQKYDFNDKNNMVTTVELSLDYKLDPDRLNLLHTKITDVETKIIKTVKSAGKEVVPQYSAVELNITKRQEAESKITEILSKELPEFYVLFARVQMTDVDIPKSVAKLAEQTAVQLGKNELAKKKEAEKIALAKAKVAESKGNYEAAQYDAKTKDIMSQPKMLELKRLEIQEIWAKKGKSPYGNNNVFGAGTAVVKGLK
jgi:regulator of protease activity HflC (stomatin/prohibitin superfamily)